MSDTRNLWTPQLQNKLNANLPRTLHFKVMYFMLSLDSPVTRECIYILFLDSLFKRHSSYTLPLDFKIKMDGLHMDFKSQAILYR